ncbi:MAG: hypothetical protein FJW80_05295 [Actinobacteria bacterium]|nr:hypothetical protein [Actinomycetota bacterium]
MSYTQIPDSAPLTVVVPVLSPSDSRRQALTRAAVVRHPGLVDITSVREVETGLEVSFCPPAGARRLEVHEREWSADDVVRLLAPVAAGLAQLHDADCVHGAVTLDRLWVRLDGAGLVAPGIAHGVATDDVRDLVSLMRDLLPAHSVGGDLASLLIMGSDPDVSARPSMARVAAILGLARRRSAPLTSPPAQRRAGTCPEHVVFPPTTPSAKVPRPRHAAPAGRLPRRPTWRMVALIVGTVAAGVLLLGAARGSDAPVVCPATTTSQMPPGQSPDRWSDRSS